MKRNTKWAVNYVSQFERCLIEECKGKECEGVICGHIHTAAMSECGGIQYFNCGDWVESMTAIGETEEGIFELIEYKGSKDETL